MTWSAEGYLTWDPAERRSDRYGSVLLYSDADYSEAVDLNGLPVGERRRLVAEVVETVPSTHIGDLFRGIFPPPEGTPTGERLVLGEGEVFASDDGALGLRPDGGRRVDWLDPHALYRVHEHRVRLTLEVE